MQKPDILDELKNSLESRVKLAVTDIDGVLRGKIIHKQKLLDILEKDMGFCDVIFGWDVQDELYDKFSVTGWNTGFPDARATVDANTFRKIPWEGSIPFFLADFSVSDHPACPRSLLKKVQQQVDKADYQVKMATEFEWFNFSESPQNLVDKAFHHLDPVTPGMFGYSILRQSQNSDYFNALFSGLSSFGVPLEGIHTETGPGVYEACIQHTDVLEAADRAVLFKTGVKEIALKNGLLASFMARWNNQLPGCSGHIHQSLWQNGSNVFFDKDKPGAISSVMESYIAGQLVCLPEILPMYAPTINSYKRLVEGAWAPVNTTWGIENRTTALRVINASEGAMRLETRVPGADINPYLAVAAALASGLYGVTKKLKLDQPATQGNAYKDTESIRLPADLTTATAKMKKSAIAEELFGAEFVAHFVMTREWECRQFQKQVTDWELKRYFEII
ncbi:glutamine synthetase [Fulvivirga sp. M361]|uniref:glutamine synthetase family protein n=1 Tax=Fulvivirga sp. M361 TaxID=2594266 RepID=UPI00117A423F|nr:glutamine synthetase [Fulvivirga sp. M361]TRX60802.1 glutamine synthetase [Fulvivirga sp. M361]